MAAAAMSVVYVLTTPIPEDGGDDPTVEQVMKRNKWDNDDYVCRGLILKGMSGSFIRYSAKLLNLEKNYDLKHTMNHKKEELTLVELGSHLRIEESFRTQDSNKPKGNNVVDQKKEFLSSNFSMKDMEKADVILGIRIKHRSNGIAISLSYYIEKVLKKFNYFDCTPVSDLVCLMYAMTCTRPDIAFAVGKLSRYTSNSVLEVTTNASWISNTEDNSSTSGKYSPCHGGGAISWASKKQTCITGSTMESEFVALAAAGKEAECAATLAKAYSQMYNGKSRHLGVRHSMIHELIMNGVKSIEFVISQQNLADHLTIGLARSLETCRMCLEPADKEDEVVNFLMVNFFGKVLSRSIDKEEPSV
ncbi:zinc finger, CCHC-type containing protein [Tanacetum coccineum]